MKKTLLLAAAACLAATLSCSKDVEVSGVSLNQTDVTIKTGETFTLVATVSPSDASDPTVTWTSDNSSVATVDNNGKVTTIATGTANVKATAGAFSATCKVTVFNPVESITLDQTTASVKVGKTITLTATVSPDNASDPAVTWTSSDEKIATVADGTVTAVAAGEVKISAKAGEKTATCTVTVQALDPIDDITLKDGEISFSVNIDASHGYCAVVEEVSEIQGFVDLGYMDSALGCLAQALYNNSTALTGASVTRTSTDPFFYGMAGGKAITADGTYYIAVVALDAKGEFDNKDIVMVTYPAK